MNIGRRVDYALRALAYLAAQPAGQIVSRREIQNQQDIPAHFLSKIMKRLVSAGVVCSHVGAKGGFTLGRPAAEVSVKEVYECLEGPLLLMECLERGERACRYCTVCSQISVWREAQKVLAAYLDRISLEEFSDTMGLRERLARRLAQEQPQEYREPDHQGEQAVVASGRVHY